MLRNYFLAALEARDRLYDGVRNTLAGSTERYAAVSAINPNTLARLQSAALQSVSAMAIAPAAAAEIQAVRDGIESLLAATVQAQRINDPAWAAADNQLSAALNRLEPYARMEAKLAPRRKPAKRRKRQSDASNPLTPKQLQAMQIVGECKGNISAAAKRIGCHRATVEQHYRAALKKLGRTAVKHKTHQAPLDRRGQEKLAHDRRG